MRADLPTGASRDRVDVDFSLALHNRTGKYFIGRDIIADQAALIGRVRYWRLAAATVPSGLSAKLLGRGLVIEQAARERGWLRDVGVPCGARPTLHLDPSTVLHARLEQKDLVLCHDLGPLTHPQLFAPGVAGLYRRAHARIADAGPGMIFVSETSRAEFVRHVGALPRMRVIYPPVRAEVAEVAAEPVAGLAAPFLLTVGSIGTRKNQAASIAAFARSGLAAEGWQYAICGGREPGAEAVEAAARRTPGVRLLPYVTDGQLAWLYRQAAGFVLMSLLEGFGVPVAEAIAHGLVPLVSSASVLQEVAGSAALSADPRDEGATAAAMRTLAAMSESERALRRWELTRSLRRFSRERFAQEWRSALLDDRAAA